MSIITVSGEMGSLRDELALEICTRGHMECVDRRTLMDAVQGLFNISRDEQQLLAEQGPALLDMGLRQRRVFAAFLESVVLQYAQSGNVVLVGRGANLLLKLVPGVLRVRTVAPLELRAQRLSKKDGLDLDAARRYASRVDQERRTYIAHVFGADWSSSLNYDLVLNMGRLSLEQAALTTLDLAAHADYQPSSETQRLIGSMVLAARVRREVVEGVEVSGLEIHTSDGKVVLEGFVSSQEEATRAEELAASVEGVEAARSALEVSPGIMKYLG